MYWSPNQYQSLAGLSRGERQAILRSAYKERSGWYRTQFLVASAATAALCIYAVKRGLGTWLASAPLSDWRKWAPLALVIVLVYGAYLWEVNGPLHTAVKKYLADRRRGEVG